MNYRPEIDGLRSIAVLPVIFFHAGFEIFSGGFVGVDVFFVISGYLITTIIYQEIVDRRFSIWRFYEKRARRILPALIVVSLACIPFAWFWMLPNEFNDFSQSLVSIASFTSNILFWYESGYFAASSELKPLLHTWSLSIEEQFYILYPLLLIVLYNFFSRRVFILIGIFGLLSLGLAQWASYAFPEANFYLLPSRAWELGAGALVALYLNKSSGFHIYVNSHGVLASQLVREFASLLGLIMILYAIFVFDKTLPFPSFWTLVPVLGAALIILAADRSTIVGRILSLRLFVGIGLISYSAYLWHQPLFAFARIRLFEGVPSWVFILLIALNFFLAWGTWLAIEMPARKQLKLTGHILLGVAFASCILVITLGILGQYRGVLGYSHSVDITDFLHSNISPVRAKCHATESKPILPSEACVLGGESIERPNIYLWGDSHGVELSYALAEELKNKNAYIYQTNKSSNLIQLTASQCIPTPGVLSTRESHCLEHNKHVFEYLIKQAKPGIVILTARWPLYLIGERVQQINGCDEGTDFTGRFITTPNEINRNEKVANKVHRTIVDLIGAGHKVVFVHAAPEPGCDIPKFFARQEMFSRKIFYEYPIEMHLKRQIEVDNLLSFTSDEKVTFFDQTEVFCDRNKSVCFASDGVGLFYFDNNHPSLYASRIVALNLVEKLIRINWLATHREEYGKKGSVK